MVKRGVEPFGEQPSVGEPGERVVGRLVAQLILLLAQPVDQARVVVEGEHLPYHHERRDRNGAGHDEIATAVVRVQHGNDQQHVRGGHRGVRQEAHLGPRRVFGLPPVGRARPALPLPGEHDEHRDQRHGHLSGDEVRLIGHHRRGAGLEPASQ